MQLSPDVQNTVRLRYEQQGAMPNLPPLGQAIVQAALTALDGSPEAARAGLRDAIREHDALAVPGEALLVHLVVTALVCGDLDLVSDALSRAAGPDATVRVSLRDGAARHDHPTFVKCTIAGPRDMGFTLSDAIFGAPGFLTLVNRWLYCVPLIRRAAGCAAGRSGSIRLHLTDGATKPGLGFCTWSGKVTLIPDPDFLRTRGYQDFRAHLQQDLVPWDARRPVALWRGAANGLRERGQGWRTLQRVRLCEATQGPDAALFDVGITANTLPPHDPGRAELPQSGLMRAPVEATSFQAYRYQIDIDGFTNAWSGLFQKLLTGSAVLKVQSERGWRQWYYDRLKPWTHFVPVTADLGDIADKTRWLIGHDRKAARIGAAGRALAESLTHEAETASAAETITGVLD